MQLWPVAHVFHQNQSWFCNQNIRVKLFFTLNECRTNVLITKSWLILMKVMGNWSELHSKRVTFYKTHTLGVLCEKTIHTRKETIFLVESRSPNWAPWSCCFNNASHNGENNCHSVAQNACNDVPSFTLLGRVSRKENLIVEFTL